MPKKTDKTMILLNFNDTENPWKDECENTWTVYGNPKLVYDNTINSYVGEFNQNNKDRLQLNQSFTFYSNNSYTIDGIVCILNMQNINYNKYFTMKENINSENLERIELGIHDSSYKPYFCRHNWIDKEIPYGFNNKYFHFALVSDPSSGSYFFINGICYWSGINSTYLLGKNRVGDNPGYTTYNYTNLAYDLLSNNYISCRFKYFRITKEALFTSNFNDNDNYYKIPNIIYLHIDTECFSNINRNINKNISLYTNSIKNIISYNYNNINRNIIWNQKTNFYSLDPKY